jgi:hypothetical protein
MADNFKPASYDEIDNIMRSARKMQSQAVLVMIDNAARTVLSVAGRLLGLRPSVHNVRDFSQHQMQDVGVRGDWSDQVDNRRARINAQLSLSAQ